MNWEVFILSYMEKVGEKIRKLREETGTSQQKIADLLGVTRQSLSLYEKGERTINVEALGKLAEFFGVSADYLLGLSDVRSTEQDMRTACEVTGLSEKAIRNIQSTYCKMPQKERKATKEAVLKNDELEEIVKKETIGFLLSEDETGKKIIVRFLESEDFEEIAYMIKKACQWKADSKKYENKLLEMRGKNTNYSNEEFLEALRIESYWSSLYKASILDAYELIKKFVEFYADTEQEVHPDGEMEQETAE